MEENRNFPDGKQGKNSLSYLRLGLFAVFLSFGFLLPQSLRLDESQSLWQSAHSPPVSLQYLRRTCTHPSITSSCHFWQGWLGNGVATARLLSLLFYLLAIPLLYALGRAVFDEKTAIFRDAGFCMLALHELVRK